MTSKAEDSGGTVADRWADSAANQDWAWSQARHLLRFFSASLTPAGHFGELDDGGELLPEGSQAEGKQQNLLTVTRWIHSYALGQMLGIPGCDRVVRAGLETLARDHWDRRYGGFFAAVDSQGPTDDSKATYLHAHVLLASSSALSAGHQEAAELLEHDLEIIDRHLWEPSEHAAVDSYNRDWSHCDAYRGTNSNMHLTEALMAGAEATGRKELAERAALIADKLINGYARANGWLLPEHYDQHWRVLMDYNADKLDDPFRPFGATVGHSCEWSRLVLSVGMATGAEPGEWYVQAAEELFRRAVEVGWDTERGGMVYTVDWSGKPANPDRYWWSISEAAAAADYLHRVTGKADYEQWNRRFWEFASEYLIDEVRGGWYPMLDKDNQRKSGPWFGKPDIYHAFQATVLPMLPLASSAAGAVSRYLRGQQA